MIDTEIIYYDYCMDWNLDQLFQPSILELMQPKFPLVVSCTTGLQSPNKISRDFYVENKKRGKPSELRVTNRDSLVTYVAKSLGVKGHVSTVSAECSGSLYALYTASLLSQAYNSPVIVFCADNILDDALQMWRFQSFGALDQNTGRPFDDSSKGFRMGVGAAIFLIKHPSVSDNLEPFSRVWNYNFYTNPELAVNPGNIQDLIENIQGIRFNEIDLWNAHATGTPVGDKFEIDLFRKLIDNDIPIIGYKGYIGHCTAASGLLELACMFDDNKKGQLRPNIIMGNPIIEDSRIITDPQVYNYKKVLKTNLGFGGKNVICQINFL